MTKRTSPVWHPFTQHALVPEAIPVARAAGAWIETRDGRRILDAISSWWVITHGHCHPRIVAAIREQAERLDQVIFAGFTHEPAERLATELVEFVGSALGTPEASGSRPLTRVFFSDSGSTSVEVALKMALGYWRNVGQPRTRIAALEHGYHGDTIGAMSAGARGVFNAAYEPLLFDVTRLPFPAEGHEQQTLDALERACLGGDLAALIVEPLVLGAGGMLTYRPHVLTEMRRISDHYGTLLIADEVMTGWGRTGTLLASQQAHVCPDILCLAKGITGGSMPLAVTLCSEEIFAAHYSTDRSRTFFHSSSYTANPIACAAALANVSVWRDEPVFQRISTLAGMQEDRLTRLSGGLDVKSARRCGTIVALDVDVSDAGYLAGIGPRLSTEFIGAGVLLRPLGSTVYVMPPYCVAASDLDLVYDVIASVVKRLKSV